MRRFLKRMAFRPLPCLIGKKRQLAAKYQNSFSLLATILLLNRCLKTVCEGKLKDGTLKSKVRVSETITQCVWLVYCDTCKGWKGQLVNVVDNAVCFPQCFPQVVRTDEKTVLQMFCLKAGNNLYHYSCNRFVKSVLWKLISEKQILKIICTSIPEDKDCH